MQIVAPDKRQLAPSVIGVLVALPFTSAPVGFASALILGVAVLIAFLCGLNAILDIRDMSVVQGTIAALWFCGLLVLTPVVLYHLVAIRDFATK